MNIKFFNPDLSSKLEIALDWELKLAGIYAEIAKEIPDPVLQSLIYSLSGDAYGHFRTLAIFQSLTESPLEQNTSSTKGQPYPTSRPLTKKLSFPVKTTNTKS